MDKDTMIRFAKKIAEWNEIENPYAALAAADAIIGSLMREIEDEAELGGWFSELEQAVEKQCEAEISLDGEARDMGAARAAEGGSRTREDEAIRKTEQEEACRRATGR